MLARKLIFPSAAVAAILPVRPRTVHARAFPDARDMAERFERLNKADQDIELLKLRQQLSKWPPVSEYASFINACADVAFLSDLSYLCIVFDKLPLDSYKRVRVRETVLDMYKGASNDEKEIILALIDYYGVDE